VTKDDGMEGTDVDDAMKGTDVYWERERETKENFSLYIIGNKYGF